MKRIAPEFVFTDEQLNTVKRLARECGLLEDTVKILYGRGVDDAEKINRFINPSSSHFISPYKMGGMREAVALITKARDEGWTVVVFGDYDADGICASTVMSLALKQFGITPVVYVPERTEGYGLHVASIDSIFEEHNPRLFITVDCGISGYDVVEHIKSRGAEVIVTDHHELPDRTPDCICINPKFNDGYPYDNLCGAGVAYKVATALNGEWGNSLLDFVAIATVADSVPLTGENRDIVYEGLKLMNSRPRSAYSLFLTKGDAEITAQTISFGIAPKINAAGRMGNANSAVKLFTETDENKIFDLSCQLCAYNLERQKYCDELYLSAKEKLDKSGAYDKVIMLWDENWNTGFVGIVAARIAEEYARPTLLFAKKGDMLKGSARSIDAVNVYEALKSASQYIYEFGGHAQAAGVTITEDNFQNLETSLNTYFSTNYDKHDFEEIIYVSGVLNGEYSTRFAKEIERLEPYGVGNKRPLFVVEEGASRVRPVKPQSPHLTIKSDKIELMYFSGSWQSYLIASHAPKSYVFEYNVSKFRGKEYVKGYVRDVIPAPTAGASCPTEIAVNNLLTLSLPKVECTVSTLPCADIDKLMGECDDYGTLFIASDYNSLGRYKNAGNLSVELFNLSSDSLTSSILVSPQSVCTFGGYKQIVFLDSLPSGVRLPALKGFNVIICSDVCGYNYLKQLSTERTALLKIYSAASANSGSLYGANSGEVALGGKLGEPLQAAFALEVFRQLSLIAFEDEKFRIYRGQKTDLANSQLYNIVKELNA